MTLISLIIAKEFNGVCQRESHDSLRAVVNPVHAWVEIDWTSESAVVCAGMLLRPETRLCRAELFNILSQPPSSNPRFRAIAKREEGAGKCH